MKGLIYLYQRTIANRIKKALKRPVTYIMGIFILFYIVMVYNTPANIRTILGLTGEENTKCTSLGRNSRPLRLA